MGLLLASYFRIADIDPMFHFHAGVLNGMQVRCVWLLVREFFALIICITDKERKKKIKKGTKTAD